LYEDNNNKLINKDENIDMIDENDSKMKIVNNDESVYDRKRVSFELL
jgi:hypothetical protein